MSILEILAIVVIALAAVGHYRAGIWAAVLSLFAALLAGAVAFGFYLPLAAAMSNPTGSFRFWGDGLMLLVLFWVSFLVLRLVAERFLRNRMSFQPLVDTIGGAAIGAVTGYVAAGMLVIFAQMMPVAPMPLGYEPFDLTSGRRTGHLLLRGDDMVLGLYNGLSRGALGDGRSLAAHYPADKPATRAEGAAKGREMCGRTVDDILRYYFYRRVDFALAKSEQVGVGVKLDGVPLEASKKSVKFDPGRGGVPVQITVQSAWVAPALVWPRPDGQFARVTPANLKWKQADESLRAGKADEALLVINVAFKPDTEEEHVIDLSDWHLQSVFRSADGKGREELKYPRLLDPAKVEVDGKTPKKEEGTGADATVIPLASEGTEKVPGVLDGDIVRGDTDLRWFLADDVKGGNGYFISSVASWNFVGRGRGEATLVFLVPALSQPWQYALRCGYKPTSSGTSKRTTVATEDKGVVAGLRMETALFKIDVKNVDRANSLKGLDRKPETGNEFYIVTVELSKKEAGVLLLKKDDLELVNEKVPDTPKYTGLLMEEVEKKDDAETPKRKLRKSAILAREPERKMSEDGKGGVQVSADWEVLFEKDRGAEAELTVVYEVPRGKPSSQYRLKIPDELPTEEPEWYLRRNSEVAKSSTHKLEVAKTETAEKLSLLRPDGQLFEFTAPPAAKSRVVIVTLLLSPKKEDDRGFYELKAGDLKATVRVKGESPADVAIFAIRPPGKEAFARGMKDDEVLAVRGPTEIPLAFYLPEAAEELRISTRGFQTMPVDVKQAE